jgi:hypothetical protein
MVLRLTEHLRKKSHADQLVAGHVPSLYLCKHLFVTIAEQSFLTSSKKRGTSETTNNKPVR